MKILISEIPDEGLDLNVDETLDIDFLIEKLPVKGNLDLKKVGSEVVIHGDIATEMELECSRCLKNYRDEIHAPVDVIYHPVEELKGDIKHEIREDELDMGFYSGDEFDLLELVKEQVILNIPMKPLCKETCKGICPTCGTDLNIDICSCKEKSIDTRLEVLKKLFVKGV